MPAWLAQFVIHVGLSFGIPFVLKHIPWLPKEVVAIIQELVEKIEEHKADLADSIEHAKDRIASHYDK